MSTSNANTGNSPSAFGAARSQSNNPSLSSSHEVHDAMSGLRDMGADVGQKVQEGYEQVRETANQYIEQGREKAMELGETIEHQIRAQPVAAMLCAVGVGFLVGAIWSRST